MKNKRVIGVITIKENIAVQSFGYEKYLPLGSPEVLVKNLDRWGADEILINVIDRTKKKLGPDFNLLKSLQKLQINTPIIYGGGISSVDEAKKVINLGADRLLIEGLLYKDIFTFKKISDLLGSQAILMSLPLSIDNKKSITHFNYLDKSKDKLHKNFFYALDKKLISEVIVIDHVNEGYENTFNLEILNIDILMTPIICFGGIKDEKFIKKIINKKNVSAIAVGNSLNYSEISIQNIKKKLEEKSLENQFIK